MSYFADLFFLDRSTAPHERAVVFSPHQPCSSTAEKAYERQPKGFRFLFASRWANNVDILVWFSEAPLPFLPAFHGIVVVEPY
jgi:hypothetical protein